MSNQPCDERQSPRPWDSPDVFPALPSDADARAINRENREWLAGRDDEAILAPLSDEEMDAYAEEERQIREASRQTHRHHGCGHTCGDGRCVIRGWMLDPLCTSCVRGRWLGEFQSRRVLVQRDSA